ncbi:hypothetical protein M433DRAFT_511690 [Acidomyces richmondensis BFW]|nr:MAG: hypothetical protein FE78DRAFT_390526 [Acidomyces sp. 'richmondensis']KYG47200.1 hypothetical protein M433DRAFT_511690 [Acidomyces richmondensis BFW]
MSLQPPSTPNLDRTTIPPFLLRCYWRTNRPLPATEFSVPPPANSEKILDYSQLLPPSLRQNAVQIYTWPTCTLRELTALLTSVLPSPAGLGVVGARVVYKLVFPDTRAEVRGDGRGRWVERALGAVVVGDGGGEGDEADKTLADARFVIGDYVAAVIYPPTATVAGEEGRGSRRPLPPPYPYGSRDVEAGYGGRQPGGYGYDVGDEYRGGGRARGPPARENGYGVWRGGGGRGYGGGGGVGGGGRERGGAGPPLPSGDWRRGERPPGYGRAGGGGW